MVSTTLASGTVVDRYVVLEWLGQGGAGVVYKAYDPQLDRKVALKLLAAPAPVSHGVEDELLREARTMAKLTHPHVVKVNDVGIFEGRLFLVMEFVDGPSLRDWLRQEARTPKEILAAYVGAGQGLAAAHAAGIIHRDFKPENVLIGKDGLARVTDFGLALASLDPDARGDQFSFCVALYEALYGERPLSAPAAASPSGDDGHAGAAPVHAASPEGAHSFPEPRGRIPRRLRNVLLRGVSADPEQRYPSMTELLAELTRDRRSAVHRVFAGAAVAVVLLGAGFAWRHRAAPAPQCAGPEQRLAGIWDEPRKQAIARIFLDTGKPYAADAWNGVRATLDAYAHDWGDQFTEACTEPLREKSAVASAEPSGRAEGASGVLDLRMACLHERLDELRALTDIFAKADTPVVARAIDASQKLTRISTCRDVKALTARFKPPADAAVAAKVDELRAELTTLKAMENATKYQDALPRAARAAEAAGATGYPLIHGEALFQYGALQGRVGDWNAAEATLYKAAWAADGAGDDRTRARVWNNLIFIVAYKRAGGDRLDFFREQELGALARLGGDDELRAEFLNCYGAALRSAHQVDAARATYEEAVPLVEKVFGDESRPASIINMNLGNIYSDQRAYDLALARYERALAIGQKVLGAHHPALGSAYSGIAGVYFERNQPAEAEDFHRRGLDIKAAALGAEHPDIVVQLNGVGLALVDRGKPAEAVVMHRRALAIAEKQNNDRPYPDAFHSFWHLGEAELAAGDTEHAIKHLERALTMTDVGRSLEAAELQFALTRALTARDPRRARTLATDARIAFEKEAQSPREKRNLALITTWLTAHP